LLDVGGYGHPAGDELKSMDLGTEGLDLVVGERDRGL